MDAAFAAAEGAATPSAAHVAALRALLAAEGPALPSRALARYTARLAAIERRAAPPPAAFVFALPVAHPHQVAHSTVQLTSVAPVAPPVATASVAAPREGVEEIRDRRGERIALQTPDTTSVGKPVAVHLVNLTQCHIEIAFPVAALSASTLTDCTLIVPTVLGSAFVDATVSSRLVIGAAQIRLRSVRGCVLAARSLSAPLIEGSAELGLAPWPPLAPAPPPAEPAWREWLSAQDMSWARPEPSPHWRAVAAVDVAPRP